MQSTREISRDTLAEVRERGYAIVPDVLSPAELAQARSQAFSLVPQPDSAEGGPTRKENLYRPHLPFGGSGHGLAQVVLSPVLIRAAEVLLGTTDLILTRANLNAKYPGERDFEQELHLDYLTNLVDYPRNDGAFLTVNVIVYLMDVDREHGPTYVVPFDASGDDPVPWKVSREDAPELYEREVPALVRAGGALLYTQATLHRGSRFLSKTGMRLSLHFVYKAGDAHGTCSYPGWAYQSSGELADHWVGMVESLSPRQRQLLGFRPPGHPYWNERTIAGVARRYPGMDMTEYRPAVRSGGHE